MRQHFIAGAWQDSTEPRSRAVINPATLELVEEVCEGGGADVGRAVAAAKEAQHHWRKLPAVERGKLLHGIARALREDRGTLSRLMTLEGGKPRIENLDEVEWCAA